MISKPTKSGLAHTCKRRLNASINKIAEKNFVPAALREANRATEWLSP